ncbi:YjgN family protein [Prosthecodimorpha staleyi]|uniref:DUF898 domain-containing protein n=1 Tax=Prosthecodimorpha staleyi TaxID=2840188 RepID=A0A947D577_9HYPH|nr:YjgN family protein [Prosthecodimorpha staleyi]MBT9288402.1 DUF898 domain-containing protein [Prosthecodimorpha staleyi]
MTDLSTPFPMGAMPEAATSDTAPTDGEGVRAAFDGETPGISSIAFAGGLYTVLTLGLYRFWYATDLRRQLWHRSSLGGTPFEYVGTVREIFVGFLVMLTLLAPIYALFYLSEIYPDDEIGQWAGLGFLVSIFFFSGFATYRARRYRLSRTLWRGVRFGQTGSAVVYALRNFGWLILSVVTLGLAVPFWRASQERMRINNSWYGDRRFASTAAGLVMLPRFLVYLLPVLGPLAVAIANVFLTHPYEFLAAQVRFMSMGGQPDPSLVHAFQGVVWTILWACVGAFLLWPFYRTGELRRFIGRVRLGETRFRSDITAWAVYKSHIAFAFTVCLSGAIGGLLMAALLSNRYGRVDTHDTRTLVLTIVGYALAYWLFGALRLVMLTAPVWGKLVGSVTVEGIGHLDTVAARRDRSSATGDDYAGGYDVGAL